MTVTDISNILSTNCIETDLKAQNKEEVIEELVNLLENGYETVDKGNIIKAILEREELSSTGLEYGFAFPHGKCSKIEKIYTAFGKSAQGIDYDSLDGQLSHFFFLMVCPDKNQADNLEVLAQMIKIFREINKDKKGIKILKEADEPGKVFNVLTEYEHRIKKYG